MKRNSGARTRRKYYVETSHGTLEYRLDEIPRYDPWKTAKPGDWFDEKAAGRAIKFFAELLRHTKGPHAGKPFIPLRWQRCILGNLFGWKRADGTRRYRKALIEVGKKNGKTEFASGIAIYMLFGDGEPGAEIYCAAAAKDQARCVGDACRQMIRQESRLASKCRNDRQAIVRNESISKIQPISAEAGVQEGKNPSCVIVDELHVFGDADLLNTLQSAFGARLQPLLIMITTAGTDKRSPCYQEHTYADGVRTGKIPDHAYLPCLWGAEDDDDWTCEEVWQKANPSLGHTVSIDFLRAECATAQKKPAYETTFRQYFLSQWVSVAKRWLREAAWAACRVAEAPADIHEAGAELFIGIDLSSTTDLTAVAKLWKRPGFDSGGERYHLEIQFLVPEEAIEIRSKQDRVPYDLWQRSGHLIATPGAAVDYVVVQDTVRAAATSGGAEVRAIGYDRYGAQQMAQELAREGLPMVEVPQAWSVTGEPTKLLEALVLSGRLTHSGNPVMDWCASNVVVEMDSNGNLKASKRRSTERIDGVAATITALAVATEKVSGGDEELRGPSVYESRGLTYV